MESAKYTDHERHHVEKFGIFAETISMRRSLIAILILSLGLMTTCSDSEVDALPFGHCRVSRISLGEGMEINFSYNDEGLLTGYSMPLFGSNCRAILEYDADGRLSKRTELCGDRVRTTADLVHFDDRVEAKYCFSSHPEPISWVLYYNEDNVLDSVRIGETDYFFEFGYDNNGNLLYSQDQKRGCTWRENIEIAFDDGINPGALLKESWNHRGMESIWEGYEYGSHIATKNNRLSYRWRWVSHCEGAHRVDRDELYEYAYEYYGDTAYPKSYRHFENGIESHGTTRFFYERCQ